MKRTRRSSVSNHGRAGSTYMCARNHHCAPSLPPLTGAVRWIWTNQPFKRPPPECWRACVPAWASMTGTRKPSHASICGPLDRRIIEIKVRRTGGAKPRAKMSVCFPRTRWPSRMGKQCARRRYLIAHWTHLSNGPWTCAYPVRKMAWECHVACGIQVVAETLEGDEHTETSLLLSSIRFLRKPNPQLFQNISPFAAHLYPSRGNIHGKTASRVKFKTPARGPSGDSQDPVS